MAGKWQARDIIYAASIFSFHVLSLFAPFTFNWSALAVAFLLYVLTGLGITLSYHRHLAHRSFKVPKYVEYLFAYVGLHAYQGDPIFWVSTHRYHHKGTDTPQDPHSPIEGFWFSHINWIFDRNKIHLKAGNYTNVEDLRRQSFYRFLSKTMIFHVFLLAAILYKLGGFPFVVWGMGVRTVWLYHAIFAVNSICHTWGYRAWKTTDLSKNNWLIGVLALGEGWHNNHHAFEYSARHGLDWWQMDLTWYVIKLLEHFGLATDVKLPSEKHMQRLSLKIRRDAQDNVNAD